MTSSAAIYDCNPSLDVTCPYGNYPTYYRLHHLFDQTFHNHGNDYFLAWSGTATVTITLTTTTYINKIKVYPVKDHYTKFKVTCCCCCC